MSSLSKVLNGIAVLRNVIEQRWRHARLRRRGVVVDPTAVVKGRWGWSGRIRIGKATIIQSAELDGRGGVAIGDHAILDQCTILSAQHDIDNPAYPTTYAAVEIGDYAIVYQGALILPGRKVGRGAVVAAHSVVTDDVPPMAVVAGNPARIVRQRTAVHDACDLQAMAAVDLRRRLKSAAPK